MNDFCLKSILFFLVFFSFLILFSCKKENSEPRNKKNIAAKIKLISGNNQSGEFNTTLKDSLVVQVTDLQDNPVRHAPVYFEAKSGIGQVSSSYVWTDSSGYAFAKFQLSCYSSEHQVMTYLCDDNSKNIDSVAFKAISVKPVRWGRACGINYTAEKIREYNNKYYAVLQGKLYASTDGGLNWDLFSNVPSGDVFDVQFNSKGWMYLLTKNNGVYYSVSQGDIWFGINNGLIDKRYPLSFLVEDTVMYVSYMFDGLYRTRDNGQFWKKLLINGKYNEEYSFVTRHPSGKLYLFDKWDQLWMSPNYGDNWSAISLSYKYLVYEISAFKIGNDGLLYIGSGDATIAVVSPNTYTGETHSYYKYNSWSQSVNSIFLKDNIVYFTILGSSDPGIYSSNGWKRIENGFYKRIQTFLLKPDGKFLIGSDDNYPGGLFYE